MGEAPLVPIIGGFIAIILIIVFAILYIKQDDIRVARDKKRKQKQLFSAFYYRFNALVSVFEEMHFVQVSNLEIIRGVAWAIFCKRIQKVKDDQSFRNMVYSICAYVFFDLIEYFSEDEALDCLYYDAQKIIGENLEEMHKAEDSYTYTRNRIIEFIRRKK